VTDRVIFVCIIVLAAVYFYATSKIPSLEIGDPLGPKAFPNLLGIVLVVTAVMLLMEMWRDRGNTNKESEIIAVDRDTVVMITGVVIWTAIYLAFFELLGYVIATTIYLIGLMAYFHRGKWTTNVVTSVLFCVGSYVMFTKVLGVNLAKGILPF
jgi:putative tricarboxylic transport membrane protein